MRVHLWKTGLVALVAGALFAGCNLFGSNEREIGSEAESYEQQLQDFLNGDGEIWSDELFEIAKESRAAAAIGILSVVRELSQTNDDSTMHYPFESYTYEQRQDKLRHVQNMKMALALLLYANWHLENGEAGRPAEEWTIPTEAEIIEAANRVIILQGQEPCSFYPDYIITSVLAYALEFRQRVYDIAPNAVISSVDGNYAIDWNISGSLTAAQADNINGTIYWLKSSVITSLKPMLNAAEFGCPAPPADIIDPAKVNSYLDHELVASMEKYYVNSGTAGNRGIGDNDGDGQIDEELFNGLDDDGDGLIDEDSRI